MTIGQGGTGGAPEVVGATGGNSSISSYLIGSSSNTITVYGAGPTVTPGTNLAGVYIASSHLPYGGGGTGGTGAAQYSINNINGTGSLFGGGGGGGGSSANFYVSFGIGGTSVLGGSGGRGATYVFNNFTGSNGTAPGGGGGGGGCDNPGVSYTHGPGGDGANGRIIITVW